MAQVLTARVAAIAFGVELVFSVAIAAAYVHLFDVQLPEDRAAVLVMVGVLYLVKTGALVGYLAWLLRPIERWLAASGTSPPVGEVTRRAARAAYDTPLLFALIWATSWFFLYFPVTAVLRGLFADRIPLSARAVEATVLFGFSCFAAALPLSYALLGWLLGPISGRISLSASQSDLPLPGRRLSVRARLVVLSLSLIAAPTAWMGVTAYMSQVWTVQRDMETRAGLLADGLVRELAPPLGRAEWEATAHARSTPLDTFAVASADGAIVANGAAARELAGAPGLQFRLGRALSHAPAGAVSDPSTERAAAYRRLPAETGSEGPPLVALVISRRPERSRGGELINLLLFALVALSWAPVCAGFLAGSIAGPLGRISAVVAQIVTRGDTDRLGRIPVFHRDEIGELAEGVNEMVDRLQASSERIRRDAAERERLLEIAARRAAELDAVLDNMVEGVFACDRSGDLTHINAAGVRLLDLSHLTAESSGSTAAAAGGTLQPLHPDGRPFSPAELPLRRALAGEVIVEEDEVLESRSSRRPVFLRSSAAPIRDKSGAIMGAVEVARDVSEVVELDRLKDQFIRVAAHELKTPVAILKGYSLTLMRSAQTLSPGSRKMLEAIARGADRINGVIEDLVDVSQASLDLLHLAPVPVDLDALVRSTVAGVRTSELHRLVVRSEVTGPLVVRADEARTRQAFGSLLGNAVKYSPAGGTIEVMLGVDRSRGEAAVSVRDPGVGIPTEKQARIFHLFYRAHTDTPYDYGGMGVGLYMANQLITRQGGRVSFESREGEGSTFSFTLPLA